MVGEQEQRTDIASVPPTPAPPVKRRHGILVRIAIGAAISFVALSLLYGVDQAAMLVALAVICTVGLGLIPLLFVSWLVGWVALEIWDTVAKPSDAASAS